MINKIEVYTKSRNVYAERNFLGISGENDVETLEFVLDNFIEGQAYIELEKLDTSGEKQRYFIKLDKKDDSYVLKVKSSLLDVIQDIKMQLVIRQGDNQVFKSKEFEMQVLTAINATSTIPEQYPTWFEQLEQKVQEIDDKLAETTQLEELLTRSETARQEQEESRVEAEKLRVEAEEKREQNTAKAINDIKDLKDDYDENAETKIKEYNNNSADKISEFNKNAKDSTTAFNTNVTKKTATFDERVSEATKTFNSNVTNKTEDFNSNSNTKTQEFNDNSVEKLQEFNNNAKVKKDEYDKNAVNKLNEYNENAEDLIRKVEQLQTENNELSSNMPWNTTSGKFLHITDSAKYSKNKLEISGDLEQENRSGKNKFKIPESATGYDVTLTKNEDGTFNLSGTATGNANFLAFVDLDKSGIKNGASYIFHFTKNLQAGVEFRVEMYNGTNWLRAIAPNINSTTSTSTGTANTTNATKVRFGIFVTSGTTVNIQNLGVQLEEGTTATEFEKYGATPSTKFPSMPLVCTGAQKISIVGQNYFNLNDKKLVNSLFTIDEDGWATVTVNNSTGTEIKYINFYTNKSNKIKQNTVYNIVLEIKNVTGAGIIVPVSQADDNYKGQFDKQYQTLYNFSELSSKSIKIIKAKSIEDFSDSTTFLRSFMRFDVRQSGSITFRISVIEDTNVTAENFVYEPYTEEINTLDLGTTELCAIKDINGNVVAQDRIVYKDNKWQFKKNVAIHTIDKTLLKQTLTSTNGKYRYQYFPIKNNVATAKDKNPGVCNIFSLARDGQTYNCEKGFTAIPGVWNFYDEGETLEEFITKIENVDIVVTYITKEPIYEYCTSAQSEVLDKLYNNFKLQKGVNNIIVESENGVGVNLELEYMQDLQTKLNLLEAMCVSNASQEV